MTTIRIIKRSQRNACLITNEEVVCWVQGRCVREDNTLTRMGEEALAAATQTLTDWTYENEHREEIRQQQREAAREAARAEVRVSVSVEKMSDSTDKAWKIWNGGYTYLYGRQVKSYSYLPKSQVKLETSSDPREVILVMPKWMYDQNSWWMIRVQEEA